jgi:two-component system alkaline phosphatase synthesis response regulator PhoP
LSHGPTIVFIDNTLQHILKSVDALKIIYQDTLAFNNEAEGLEYVFAHPTDVLLLNLDILPNDAVTLSKELIHRKPNHLPFIVVYSDKQDDFVYELAFNSGIDSVINFHNKPAVLNLFIKNLLGRRKKDEVDHTKNISIDTERYVVLKKGEPISLPRKEFKVFELLYNNPNKFFSKPEIAEIIWKDPAVAAKRIIDVHIYNIRQAFGKRVIQSQKGKGYRINSRFI